MNRHYNRPITTIFMVIMIALALPAHAKKETVSEYRFVGLTEYETNGSIVIDNEHFLWGTAAGNSICVEEFGKNARMAETSDVLRSQHVHVDELTVAWIRPSGVISVYNHARELYVEIDTTVGIEALSINIGIGGLSCGNYVNEFPNHTGSVIVIPSNRTSLIRYGTEPCDNIFPIACALPTNDSGVRR